MKLLKTYFLGILILFAVIFLFLTGFVSKVGVKILVIFLFNLVILYQASLEARNNPLAKAIIIITFIVLGVFLYAYS